MSQTLSRRAVRATLVGVALGAIGISEFKMFEMGHWIEAVGIFGGFSLLALARVLERRAGRGPGGSS